MYRASNSRDRRLDYATESFPDFCKMALLAVRSFPYGEWTFEGGGLELDPVADLGVPEKYFAEEYVPNSIRKVGRAA